MKILEEAKSTISSKSEYNKQKEVSMSTKYFDALISNLSAFLLYAPNETKHVFITELYDVIYKDNPELLEEFSERWLDTIDIFSDPKKSENFNKATLEYEKGEYQEWDLNEILKSK